MVITILILGVVAFLLLEAFFSGSETAIVSCNDARLHAEAMNGDRRAGLAEQLLKKSETLLGTTLVGTNLAVATGTTLAALAVRLCDVPAQWESLVTTAVMTPLILLFGEIIPKSICLANADVITLWVAGTLRISQTVMLPLVWCVTRATSLLLRAVGQPGTGVNPYVTREELKTLADIGEEHGLIAPGERKMIQSVFDLDNQAVSSVMVPLVDIVSVPSTATTGTVESLAAQTGYSRFPVHEGRVDNVVGVVSLADVLYGQAVAEEGGEGVPVGDLRLPSPESSVAPFVRKNVTFVPETKPVGALLRELRYTRIPMAIAVDEHGGVVGLATTEDLVEEIVGEIKDERDPESSQIAKASAATFECDGKFEIDELCEQLGVYVEKDGFETVGGLLMKLTGRIPEAGQKIDFQDFQIEVLDADQRRVKRARFVRKGREA